MKWMVVLCALGAVLAGAACASRDDRAKATAPTETAAADGSLPVVTFSKASGGGSVSLRVEVADDQEERTCGLMHRTSLPDDQGMLFVFERGDQTGGFWMRNTLIPLAIAYIAGDGRIVDILEMEPVSMPGTPYRTPNGQTVVVPDGQPPPAGAVWVTYPPRGAYRYAIEANKEWYTRHGITVGDRADVSIAVARAGAAEPEKICRQRGS